MATYGSNIGSTSRGAYAVFPVTGTPFDIFDANVVTGAVTAVTNAVPLSALQLAALSTQLKALIGAAPIANSEASFLRKLVGVLPLTEGSTVVLSAADQGGNVWRLSATVSGGGDSLVYVPNSAAVGLFTGAGSDGGETPVLIPYDLILPQEVTLTPPTADQVLGSIIVGRDIRFPPTKTPGVVLRCIVAPTADYELDVKKNGSVIGTATFLAGQQIALWVWSGAFPTPRLAAPGDVISFHGANVPDATIAGIFGTMLANIVPPT